MTSEPSFAILKSMGRFELFVIRLFLSIMFAFLISRFFFQKTPVIKVVGLAVIMLGLAYVLEYFRKRKRGEPPCAVEKDKGDGS